MYHVASCVRLAASLSLSAVLWSCSGNESKTLTTGELGAAGGTITVMTGPLTGTSLTLPASAVPDGTTITIDLSARPILVGFESIGPGANFVADAAELAADAAARLIFDPTLLPAGATIADVAVVRQTSQGRRATVTPNAVDLTAGTVDVTVDRFAAYWVVLRTIDVDFVLANYFPLLDGDTYLFDNGVALAIEAIFNEPNLEGLFLAKATFADGVDDFGYYLARDFTETELFGEFSTTREFQTVGVPPLQWLPETGSVGDTMLDSGGFVLFRPFGSSIPVDVLDVRLRVTIASQGRLDTPLGRFSNVLELVFETTRTDTDLEVDSTVDRMWLARGIGPVRIEIEGVAGTRRGSLVAGEVAGEPITPR